jgi:hypothetical protein
MSPLSCRFLVFATGLLLSAATVAAAPAPSVPASPKATDRFERTKERIDALLKNRLKPVPLPANPPNPFLLTEAASTTTPGSATDHGTEPAPHDGATVFDVTAPHNDAEFLAFYAGTLKISGTVQLNGRPQLIINQSPYKEGDLILLRNKEASIYLKVVRIAPGELTLGYNGVEQTLPFKSK